MMIMGNYFTFQDRRSRTAFVRLMRLSFDFTLCLDTWQAYWQSEIVPNFHEKTHPVVLKTVRRSCLEMWSDLNYNFGFVVGEIVVPGHNRKSRCCDTLKKFVLWLVSINSYSPTIISTKIKVGALWEYSYLFRKAKRF